ncbi:UDP-glycosyltransferase 83A1-like [Henckelia pumila]|uniref:UDP-glycosyltransferase 83A1-like n=1 Tax=Henckelia pumila TaxID=405737 RepID=UPI003C6DECBF
MASLKAKKPHVLAVPFPAQGHVTPLTKLSRRIADRGIKVTFVNIHNIHSKILESTFVSSENQDHNTNNIVLTSIPDGLSSEDDRNDVFKLIESLRGTMADSLTDLIGRINRENVEEPVSCIIADITVGWVLEIAEKMGAEPIVFTPASAAGLALVLHIPELVEGRNLDVNGTVVTKPETISLSSNIPAWGKDELSWSFPVDLGMQKILFECSLDAVKTGNQAKSILCNTFYDLESTACDLNSRLLPIGPLLNPSHSKSSSNYSGSFRTQDESCLAWLNSKPAASVIYVSFGSIAVFSQQQLDELALGLELSGRPFLWIVRSDIANGARAEYPTGFLERIGCGIGKIVEWAPQEKVLSHSSVACFLTHCGWNSTMEGVSMGVPFLCWPYFADQFHNQNYVCDKWKIGLRICADENGIRSRYEIKNKIQMVTGDVDLRSNALKMKELALKSSGSEEGSSLKNFEKFVDHLKKL